jgi:hypothetical protein
MGRAVQGEVQAATVEAERHRNELLAAQGRDLSVHQALICRLWLGVVLAEVIAASMSGEVGAMIFTGGRLAY